jgi:hypothetical protein
LRFLNKKIYQKRANARRFLRILRIISRTFQSQIQ